MNARAERRTDVTIRPAVARDLPAIMDLIAELDRLQEDWRVFPSRPSLREETLGRYQRAIRDQAGNDVLVVAEASGTVVGSAFGHVLVPSTVSDEPAMELSGVVVLPTHRRRGIAGALTETIARFAHERGIRMLTLKTFAQNEPALRFWERLGFSHRMVQLVAPADREARRSSPQA